MLSSSHNFDAVLGKISSDFGEKETELNWERVEEGFRRAAEALEGSTVENIIVGVKRIRSPLTSSLLSERTRLSTATMSFVTVVCKKCGPSADQLGEVLLTPLLKLCERTNKVFLTRAQQALQEYIRAAPVTRMLLPKFCEAMKSSNKGLRSVVAEFLELLLGLCPADSLNDEVLAKLLVEGMSDAAPQVREATRRAYHTVNEKCPSLGQKVYENVPLPVQKMLSKEKEGKPAGLKRPQQPRTAQVASTAVGSKIGGAQRVLKPVTESPGLTPGAKAARVMKQDSRHGTPVKASGLKSCVSAADTLVPIRSGLSACLSACQLANASNNAYRAELVQNVIAARSTDWSARHKAYEALFSLVSEEASKQHIGTSKAAAQRLFDCLNQGLSDTHFRVLEAVVRFATAMLQCCSYDMLPEPAMLDTMLARTVYLVVNPQYKGKACQEAAPNLLDAFKLWLGDEWRFITALSAAYSKPEATASTRARVSLITRIVQELEGIQLCPEAEVAFHMKLVTNRLTSALLDHDTSLVTLAASVFSTLYQRLPSESLLESLVSSVKFAAARLILLEHLQKTITPRPVQQQKEDLDSEKENEQKQNTSSESMQIEKEEESTDNMQIEHEDDPEPIFITLDEELGIQLRVRPPQERPLTPPAVEALVRSFSSVLHSPFVDQEDQKKDNDQVEMRTIDEQMQEQASKTASNAEENPFLV